MGGRNGVGGRLGWGAKSQPLAEEKKVTSSDCVALFCRSSQGVALGLVAPTGEGFGSTLYSPNHTVCSHTDMITKVGLLRVPIPPLSSVAAVGSLS